MERLDPRIEKFIVNAIPGLLVIDPKGIIIYVNEAMEKFQGHKAEEMVGHHILDFFPYTKMLEGLEQNISDRWVLYQGDGITSQDRCESSFHKIIYDGDEILGMMTYDLFQNVPELERFLEMYMNLDQKVKYQRNELSKYRSTKYTIDDIIGSSGEIQKLKDQIRRAALNNSTVLISGETGTGKELVAHSIHDLSRRCMNNFIKCNISSLPSTLIESELFGYEKGSFTGALNTGKIGKFEAANRGTLFMDEIESLSMEVQPKLLRVLQEMEIEKIGSEKTIHVDVRIIAATNVDLEELIREERFRQDLYYRLDVMHIKVPPLRKRREDIKELVYDFIVKFNPIIETDVTGISERALAKLCAYDWPGNVRELRNVIERAMINTMNGEIKDENINFSSTAISTRTNAFQYSSDENPIESVKRDAERSLILQVLDECEGNKTEAAKILKISRPLLYQKMDRLDIKYGK